MATGEPVGKSTPELLGDLTHELTDLVHHEIELAKLELATKGRRVGIGTGLLSVAGALGVFALGCFVALVVVALHFALSLWLSVLIVGLALLIIAASAALASRRELRQSTPPAPSAAIESTKEDVAWI